MYLVVIAWVYVVLLMSVAEATNTTGTVLGALVTFVLYGMLPISIVVYLMRAPGRNKAIKKRAAAEHAQAQALKNKTIRSQSELADSSKDEMLPACQNHGINPQNQRLVDPNASGHTTSTDQTVDTGVAPVGKIP
jgi:hypothetical protein